MTPAVAQLLEAAERLSAAERTELADRILESLASDIPPALARVQCADVQERITQVEKGKAQLVPGGEALIEVRQLTALAAGKR